MSLKERALETITNEKRREILRLLEKGDKSFSEIQSALKMDKGSLTYHMKELVHAGLAANIYERRASASSSSSSNARFYSFYKLTSFGAYVTDWYKAFNEKGAKDRKVIEVATAER